MCVGCGFAVAVICVSPDLWTLIFVSVALLLLSLLVVLPGIETRTRWLAIRVDPRIVLLIVTINLSIVGGEIGLRLFLPSDLLPDWKRKDKAASESLGFQHDWLLGWSPVPNAKKLLTAGARTITISNNSDGLRDIEPILDERRRIIFLGDSFVWGSGLEAQERFTDKLRAKHTEWAVYNFGVVGYGTDQEYLLLKSRFERYQPRVVFLVFCTENDYVDNCSNGGGIIAFKPYFTAKSQGLSLHGSPVPLPDYIFCQQHPFLSRPYIIRLAMRAWGNLRCPHVQIFQKDITFHIMEALQQCVSRHGAKFYVGLTAPEPELEQSLDHLKIAHIDLSTPLRLPGDFHWSPEGNTVVAERIEKFLEGQSF